MKKSFKCTVCDKKFVHRKPDTLVGSLGIIPINLCNTHFKKIMTKEVLPLNDTRKEVA